MTTSRIAALLLTCSLAGAGAVAVSPTASAAPGWTRIDSPYQEEAGDPTFQWCEVSQTRAKVTLRIRATRPSPRIVSYAVNWQQDPQTAGSEFADRWRSDRATVRVTLPRDSTISISFQTASAGYAFSGIRRTPLGLARCP